MSRYGEIIRINFEGRLYILSVFKVSITDFRIKGAEEITHCPSFCLEITARTAKKTRNKNMSKADQKFSLINDKKNVSLIRLLFKHVKEYIEKWLPKVVCLGLYGDGRQRLKRQKAYTNMMNLLGYSVYVVEGKHNDWRNNMWIVYRRNDLI